MLKFFAAFLAPIVLTLFFIMYNAFSMLATQNFSLTFSIDGFLFVYIYAFPVYLLVGVPVSMIIERINKGVRWLNYSIAGFIGGVILVFINSISSTQGFTFKFEWAFVYIIAGFSFYAALKFLELWDDRLQNQ